MADYPHPNAGGWNTSNYNTPAADYCTTTTTSTCPSMTTRGNGISAWTGTSAPRTRPTRVTATRMSRPLSHLLWADLSMEATMRPDFPWYEQLQPGGEFHGQRNPPFLPRSSMNSVLDITGASTNSFQTNGNIPANDLFPVWAACRLPVLRSRMAACRSSVSRATLLSLRRFAP